MQFKKKSQEYTNVSHLEYYLVLIKLRTSNTHIRHLYNDRILSHSNTITRVHMIRINASVYYFYCLVYLII